MSAVPPTESAGRTAGVASKTARSTGSVAALLREVLAAAARGPDLGQFGLQHAHQFRDGCGALLQRGLFLGGELDLENLFDPLRTQLDRHTHEEIPDAVLAVE